MSTSLGPKPDETYGQDLFETISLLLQAITRLAIDAIAPKWFKDDPAALKKLSDDIGPLFLHLLQVIPFSLIDPMNTISSALSTAVGGPLATLGSEASAGYVKLLQTIFQNFSDVLTAAKTTDPANVNAVADAALVESGKLAVGSRVISLLFELLLPKQLNTLNWLGPTLAGFAGFDKIIDLIREPQLRGAVGNLAEYEANSTFRTRAPDHADAEALFARRLISPAQVQKLISWSGLMAEFADAMQQLAYRPVQPFLLARAAEAGAIPAADLTAILQFDGFRDADIARLQAAFAVLSLQPYQQQLLSASVRSAELGTLTPAELGDTMNQIGLSADQQALVQLTVATRKLEQLAELYRKSISEAYGFGTLTDDQYVPALEAIGIAQADAEAHYAVDSVKRLGKAASAAAKAAQRLAAARTRQAMLTAIANYRAEQTDEAGLALALAAAGVDPVIAGLVVDQQVARKLGPQVLIYGLMLHRDAALKLREKISALEAQYKKQLIDDPTVAAELAALNIPKANLDALIADWAALKTKPTTYGELLPV